jgi:hypothetical protein
MWAAPGEAAHVLGWARRTTRDAVPSVVLAPGRGLLWQGELYGHRAERGRCALLRAYFHARSFADVHTADPSGQCAVFMGCETCGPDHQTETREPKLVSRSLLHTTTCHQLACGHAWHRTAATGNGAPAVTKCDCAS